MKNKTVLSMIEQLIMVLVFIIAVAISLRVFVYTDNYSKQVRQKDEAWMKAQSAAEILKNTKGDEARVFELLKTDDGLDISIEKQDSSNRYLGEAVVTVSSVKEELCSITVGWQEDAG